MASERMGDIASIAAGSAGKAFKLGRFSVVCEYDAAEPTPSPAPSSPTPPCPPAHMVASAHVACAADAATSGASEIPSPSVLVAATARDEGDEADSAAAGATSPRRTTRLESLHTQLAESASRFPVAREISAVEAALFAPSRRMMVQAFYITTSVPGESLLDW
eukprot:CAMPEP_0170214340 /NCGR_PEP_ID=MMETSP0116_2-20130129/6800_1 /TAXON_ID=400756 /ORGANISM="Durinskia baltica, Strain CSIRO CS-38" /LENGTH=162 /DNA_ID=CAMNT_0010464903 /DNA_START=73 /DNA_END=558 /DNA_ORIENTATION=-